VSRTQKNNVTFIGLTAIFAALVGFAVQHSNGRQTQRALSVPTNNFSSLHSRIHIRGEDFGRSPSAAPNSVLDVTEAGASPIGHFERYLTGQPTAFRPLVQAKLSAADYRDATDAELEMLALDRDDAALAAFLLRYPGAPDYKERSLQLLLQAGSRGSVFALTTLADWASVGYAFESKNIESAILFEFLAWSTGRWGDDVFVPTIAGSSSTIAECQNALVAARRLSAQLTFATVSVEYPPSIQGCRAIRDTTGQ
jgi:hypothetical protein